MVEDENLTQVQIDSVLEHYSFEYDRLIFIDSSNYAILPISTQKSRGGGKTIYSGMTYYEDSYPQYWNFIFYNTENGKVTLLTKEKMRISEYRTNLKNVGPILQNSVLYEIGNTDYDKNNALTYADPEQLFISENTGENLRRISPINESILEYHIVPNTDKIIAKTLRDTNNDFKFDREDETLWYLIDVADPSEPSEILNKTERKEIENLYFKQWLVKKK